MERKHNPRLTGLAKNLRKKMTKEERHLWYDFLKDYPIRFLRQKIIDNYIADFYCHKARLIIELDGSQHYTEAGLTMDRFRTEMIERRNLLVLRIDNLTVMRDFNGVCEYIERSVRERISPGKSGADTPG
jgi:very-short-patch-repair endonuclease